MTYPRCLFYSLCLLLALLGMDSLHAQPQQAENIYIAENDGLVYSHDGGKTFDKFNSETTGIINGIVYNVFIDNNIIYAGTNKGLSISYDNGRHFVTRTTRNGLGSNVVLRLYVRGKNVYAGTTNGLSISHNSGKTFINYAVKKGEIDNTSITDIYVDKHGRIYVTTALNGPLYISNNSGKTFHRVFIKFTSKPTVTSNPYSGYSLAVVGHILYVNTSNGLYVSYNRGKTLVPAKHKGNFMVSYTKGKNIYMLSGGSLLISHDGGKTFVRRLLLIPKDYGIGTMMALGQDIYMVGSCGYLMSHDDGKTFQHKMNNYQFKITSITPCIERYNATNDVFLTR